MNATRGNGAGLDLSPRRLRPVELGKHKALLGGIIRLANRHAIPDRERALGIPYRLLSEVAVLTPPVVTDILASPQFGAWANDALRCLLTGAPAMNGVPRAIGLGRLALFAATAAVRAGHPFDVTIPLTDGMASFPALGSAYVDAPSTGAARPWEWGRAWLDDTGCHVQSPSATVDIPATLAGAAGNWSPLPRVTVTERGLCLDVVLDHNDPFLDRYGTARSPAGGPDGLRWRSLLAAGWRILAGDHQALASIVAGAIRTVVPLVEPDPQHMASGTEETAFGAIGLSLPPDALAMAQVLVHESHHAVLGAFRDIEPLVRADDERDRERPFLGYAPWRDDPRPAHALLQGIYAHYGMGQFWRREYLEGAASHRERAAIEFGRMRTMTARGASTLAGSGLLTDAGREFLAGIEDEVAQWQGEPLPATTQEHVADLTRQHEVRWRARWLAQT